mgnify:CR=1 FL=1
MKQRTAVYESTGKLWPKRLIVNAGREASRWSKGIGWFCSTGVIIQHLTDTTVPLLATKQSFVKIITVAVLVGLRRVLLMGY